MLGVIGVSEQPHTSMNAFRAVFFVNGDILDQVIRIDGCRILSKIDFDGESSVTKCVVGDSAMMKGSELDWGFSGRVEFGQVIGYTTVQLKRFQLGGGEDAQ